MIDASKGFTKDGPKNRLRSQDIHKMVDVFTKQTEIERYSRMVPLTEIAAPKNAYNLNIPRYIDSSEPEDIQDLHAHLYGGIPDHDLNALSRYWDAFPSLRNTLFTTNRPGYSDLAVDVTNVQQTVLDSDEFKQFSDKVAVKVERWYSNHRVELESINENTNPNSLIASLGDDLLSRFRPVPLLDEYDVYEQLLSYWHSVVHDDVFIVMSDGWMKAATPRKTIDDKERKLSETPDLVVGSGRNASKYKTDLIPPALIIARYLADEQEAIYKLGAAAEEATRSIREFTEEHAVEDGLLTEVMVDDKITKALAAARLKKAKKENSDRYEIKALEHLIDLYNSETAAKKAVKDAQENLDVAALKKYGDLTEFDIKQIVLNDKWHTTISHRIESEVTALTLELVVRIQQLGERYAETVRDLDTELKKLEGKVFGHLEEMGVQG